MTLTLILVFLVLFAVLMSGGGGTPPRDLYDEVSGELQAKLEYTPDILAAEAQYRPQYTALEQENLMALLAGQPAGPSGRATRPLGETIRGAAPEQYKLLDSLTGGMTSQLEGDILDPKLRREVQQAIRAGQTARGMGYGMGDLVEEAAITGTTAEQIRQARQAQAMQLTGLYQDVYTAPLLTQANSMLRSAGPSLFGPSINAADVANTNFNAAVSQNIANQNAQAGLTSAGIAGATALGGAAIIAL